MFIGSTLHCGGTNSTPYFSPWFPRGGNRGRFTCDTIESSGLGTFTIEIETKNNEQDDSGAVSVGAGESISTSSGVTSWDRGAALSAATGQGMLELVRIKYTVKGGSSSGGWIHFRLLKPQWFTN